MPRKARIDAADALNHTGVQEYKNVYDLMLSIVAIPFFDYNLNVRRF